MAFSRFLNCHPPFHASFAGEVQSKCRCPAKWFFRARNIDPKAPLVHRTQSRFVTLVDATGAPACASVYVEFAGLSYLVSDAEYELEAIRIAIGDGLISPGSTGSVQAIFPSSTRT
jgi:hypothetical protein